MHNRITRHLEGGRQIDSLQRCRRTQRNNKKQLRYHRTFSREVREQERNYNPSMQATMTIPKHRNMKETLPVLSSWRRRVVYRNIHSQSHNKQYNNRSSTHSQCQAHSSFIPRWGVIFVWLALSIEVTLTLLLCMYRNLYHLDTIISALPWCLPPFNFNPTRIRFSPRGTVASDP